MCEHVGHMYDSSSHWGFGNNDFARVLGEELHMPTFKMIIEKGASVNFRYPRDGYKCHYSDMDYEITPLIEYFEYFDHSVRT